jgi:AcrR family transcriptional regulator
MTARVMGAADLIAERGLDGCRMEDIASATGIPKATLYYHFAGKEEILALVFDEVLERIRVEVGRAVEAHGDAPTRLRRVVVTHLSIYRDLPMASRVLHFDLGRAARLSDVVEQSERSFIEPVSLLLREGVRAGTFAPIEHPRLTAMAILGMITTCGASTLTAGTGHDVDEVADLICGLCLDGLVPRTRARGKR